MKKIALAIALAGAFAAVATPSFAQSPGPGEDRAVSSKPATKAEKADAKKARKAEGAVTAKSGPKADADPSSMGKAKSTTKDQKTAAKKARKAEGAKATKEPKDMTGPSS